MDISAKELKERMDKGETLVLIDVREPSEYKQVNIGATLIPLATLPDKLDELSQYKNQEVIVHCRSGKRSGQAKIYLEQQGFTNVRNVLGGIEAYLGL
jgi:rhodanese-related sulfurtransferase